MHQKYNFRFSTTWTIRPRLYLNNNQYVPTMVWLLIVFMVWSFHFSRITVFSYESSKRVWRWLAHDLWCFILLILFKKKETWAVKSLFPLKSPLPYMVSTGREREKEREKEREREREGERARARKRERERGETEREIEKERERERRG